MLSAAAEFARDIVKIGLREAVGMPARSKVQRHNRARFLRIRRRTIGTAEQRWPLELHNVGNNMFAVFPRVHDVEEVAALGAKPDEIAGRSAA